MQKPFELKLFKIDGTHIVPIMEHWYEIPIAELPSYRDDGGHEWFLHLTEKTWFTRDMFWELLEFTKYTFPDFKADKAIFQVGFEFGRDAGIELEKLMNGRKDEDEINI